MAMKVCVVGAGAIGGLLGGKLALSGESVSFIEKHAAHREAINKNGLTIRKPGGKELVAKGVKASEDMGEPGPQDVVVIAVKAHQISALVPGIRKLFGKDTIVVTVQNGIPWWYFRRHGGPFDGKRLESLDPGGAIDASIEAERIIGCVVYPAGEVVGPGVVKCVEGDRFPVGELDGSKSNRLEMISQMLIAAGFKSFVLDNIRSEIWLKAWGNLSFNPISALTHGTRVSGAHDGGGPGGREQARHKLPPHHREAHRGCGGGGSAQDLHAAGRGGGTRPRGGGARRRGRRAGSAHRDPDPPYRRGLRL